MRCADKLLMPASQATLWREDTQRAEKARAKHLGVNSPEKSPPRKVKWTHYCIQWGERGFIGRKKSIHNLLTEGFSVCVGVGPIPAVSPSVQMCVSRCCIIEWPIVYLVLRHTNARLSHNTHLIQTQSAKVRIYNGTAELLTGAAHNITQVKRSGMRAFWRLLRDILHTVMQRSQVHREVSNKVLTDAVGFFSLFSTSVFLPSGHLSLIPVATVIRYVNDLSLGQMQQINQGQWVPFRSRTGGRGRDIMTRVWNEIERRRNGT